MKILFELRTALDVKNSLVPVSVGGKRLNQYIKGIGLIVDKLFNHQDKSKFDVVLVDNTLVNQDYIPPEILDIIPENCFFYVKEKNDYGIYNKGAGDIELWNDYSEIMSNYDYFFHYEPRLELISFDFIQSFLDNPRNYFCLAGSNQVKTGYFGAKVKDFKEFCQSIDIEYMVSHSISIEYIMFDFFKKKETEFIDQKNVYCIWHDSVADTYKPY